MFCCPDTGVIFAPTSVIISDLMAKTGLSSKELLDHLCPIRITLDTDTGKLHIEGTAEYSVLISPREFAQRIDTPHGYPTACSVYAIAHNIILSHNAAQVNRNAETQGDSQVILEERLQQLSRGPNAEA